MIIDNKHCASVTYEKFMTIDNKHCASVNASICTKKKSQNILRREKTKSVSENKNIMVDNNIIINGGLMIYSSDYSW